MKSRLASSASGASTTTEFSDEQSRPLSNVLPVMMSRTALAEVGGALDVGRRVAGPDAVGRLSGAVGGADQSHPAGGEDDRRFPRLHQLLRALERDGLHPVDGAVRAAGSARRRRS